MSAVCVTQFGHIFLEDKKSYNIKNLFAQSFPCQMSKSACVCSL